MRTQFGMLGIMTRTKNHMRRKACSIFHNVNMTSAALESFNTDLPSPESEYQSGNQALIWFEVKAKISRFDQALNLIWVVKVSLEWCILGIYR